MKRDYAVVIIFLEVYVITTINLCTQEDLESLDDREKFYEELLKANGEYGETVFGITSIGTIGLIVSQSYDAFSAETFEDEFKEAILAVPIFRDIAEKFGIEYGTTVSEIANLLEKLELHAVEV